MLETFNTTLNDVVSKLKQNTVNTSTALDSEAFRARNIKGVQTETGSFFQNLGKNLDKLIFQVTPLKLNTVVEDSVAEYEHSVSSVENPVSEDEHSVSGVEIPFSKEHSDATLVIPVSKDEHPVAGVETSVTKDEYSVTSVQNPFIKNEHNVASVQNPFTKNERSATKAVHSTNNAIMFSSIF